jgi:hypothetical protein
VRAELESLADPLIDRSPLANGQPVSLHLPKQGIA